MQIRQQTAAGGWPLRMAQSRAQTRPLQRALWAGAAALSLLAPLAARAQDHPVTIENCGQSLTFDAAPDRVVTVGQSATEMLYALGLGERVVGTSVWFNDTLPEFQDVNAGAERLADNDPGFETVAARDPQLVAAQFESHVGPQGTVGTRAQFNELGIQVYAMPADCEGKDNLVGGDGTRTEEFRIEQVYRAVRELSQIFGVPERGAVLEADLRARIDAAAQRARAVGAEGRTAVIWFSSPELALNPYVAGQNGVAGFLLKTLGIENVIRSDEEWPTVGWETIASADPDYIIIARMDRRRFPADDHQVKLDHLARDPVTREMAAVREGRIIIVNADQTHAGIRIPAGIETIVEAVAAAEAAR